MDDHDEQVQRAVDIALHGDVSSAPDSAVFFAGKKSNMREAVRLCTSDESGELTTLLHTDAYKQLKEIPLYGHDAPFTPEESFDITGAVSARFAQEASGNVTVFVEKLSKRSTFFTVELPALLLNDDVETINNEDKMSWLRYVQPPILPQTDIIPPERLRFDTSSLDSMGQHDGGYHQSDDELTF